MPAPLFWNPARLGSTRSCLADWKPHWPKVTYSQVSALAVSPGRLEGCRKPFQPPSLRSKLQGTLSPLAVGVGPVLENRIPLSSTPFGMTSNSPLSSTPFPFRSSPSVLVTRPPAVPGTNIELNVTSSSGLTIPRKGSVMSGRSIWRFRLKSRICRPPPGKSVE